MPIKTVILDRDGTLYNELSGKLQDGVAEMLVRLKDMGLNIFVVSNENRDKKVEELIGLPTQQFFYQTDCGHKGSKKYVQKVLDTTGNALNEVVYLGDSEHDMHEASGSRVALFNAEWSNPNYRYGLAEESPKMFADDMERYFLKQHPWYFTVDGEDALQRSIRFRAVLDPDTCKNEGITALLKQRSENFADDEKSLELATHLVTHMIASVYLEGLHLEREPKKPTGFRMPVWCIYPGRSGGISPILRLFEQLTARLLGMKYEETLLQRHTTAPSSHVHRMSTGSPQDIREQFLTTSINQELLRKVKGNVVFVVDDFSTGSNAMETSRNLLLACGATRVIGITVGKYGGNYTGYVPGPGFELPKMGGPVDMAKYAIAQQNMATVKNPEAIAEYLKSSQH